MFIKIFILLSFVANSHEISSRHEYYQCKPSQIKQINRSLNIIENRLLSFNTLLAREVDSKQEFSIKMAQQVLACVQEHMNYPMSFYCNEKIELADAKTLPLFGSSYYYRYDYFLTNEKYQAGVLLHEISHKCGTTDLKIFDAYNLPENAGIISWAFIADTYNYWIQFGYFLPK